MHCILTGISCIACWSILKFNENLQLTHTYTHTHSHIHTYSCTHSQRVHNVCPHTSSLYAQKSIYISIYMLLLAYLLYLLFLLLFLLLFFVLVRACNNKFSMHLMSSKQRANSLHNTLRTPPISVNPASRKTLRGASRAKALGERIVEKSMINSYINIWW